MSVQSKGPKMWKGWTRSDMDKFNSVFLENAHEFSICPVCFKFIERETGCMYMKHNCLEEQHLYGGFVHNDLYEKYKMMSDSPYDNNKIEWCTICGRISDHHTHYRLLPPFVSMPALVKATPAGANIYRNDCTLYGGGGLPEKVARFRRAREVALELQGHVDRITEEEAMKRIIEEMWVAPRAYYAEHVQKILEEGQYNIPNTNFPSNATTVANAAINTVPAAIAPNIQRPQANRNDPALRPEVVEEGVMIDALTMDIISKGAKFHHRQRDGTIYHHEAPIGRPGFIAWFGDEGGMARNFASARFGHCYVFDCDAILYPQELEPLVDTAEEEKLIPRDLFEIYRQNFNRHMPPRLAALQGGYKRIQKTRKVKGNKRKQHGGQPHNMFIELKTGECVLPRKKQTANARGRYRKTRR
jgi:hypothetical protein